MIMLNFFAKKTCSKRRILNISKSYKKNYIFLILKKNSISIFAFSGLSDPCTEFLSIDFPNNFLIVPSSAFLDQLHPLNFY